MGVFMRICKRGNWSGLVFVLILIVLMTGWSITRGEGLSNEEGMLENIIEAVRYAQRPYNNILVEWTYEPSGQGGFVKKQDIGKKTNNNGSWTYTYTTITSGIRSRVDILAEYYPEGSDSPSTAFKELRVFNGKTFKSLKEYTSGVRTEKRPVGTIYAENKNSALLQRRLFDDREYFDLEDLRQKFSVDLGGRRIIKKYIVDLVNKFGGVRRYTIDADKGSNVIKIERIRSDGTTDYEINYQIKQYDDQQWFVAGHEFLRHPRRGTTGPPKIERKSTVKRVEFNIDVPEKTFDFEFPDGVEVRDHILNIPYIVGEEDVAILEGALQVEGAMEDSDKPDSNATLGETSHLANSEHDNWSHESQSHEECPSEPVTNTNFSLLSQWANNNFGFVLLVVFTGILLLIFYRVKRRKTN
jgi:hypothetical protein